MSGDLQKETTQETNILLHRWAGQENNLSRNKSLALLHLQDLSGRY